MTELERYDAAVARQLTGLEEWRVQAEAAGYVAKTLVGTPFIPPSLVEDRNEDPERNERATVANIAAALLTGEELGLSPMAALRSVDIIENQPAIRAIAMRALVLRAGHEVEAVDSTETRAVVRGRRMRGRSLAGQPVYGEWQQSTWTIDRATKLGLTGKRNWRTQPTAMLLARATSEVCRLVASDVLLGLPYAVEEIGDPDATTAVESPPRMSQQATRRARVRRSDMVRRGIETAPDLSEYAADAEPAIPEPDSKDLQVAASEPGDPEPAVPEPEPVVSAEPEPAPQPEPKIPPISPRQRAKLIAEFNARGVKDRGERLAIVSDALGRQVESFNHLNTDEASILLDGLAALIEPAEPDAQPDEPPEDPWSNVEPLFPDEHSGDEQP